MMMSDGYFCPLENIRGRLEVYKCVFEKDLASHWLDSRDTFIITHHKVYVNFYMNLLLTILKKILQSSRALFFGVRKILCGSYSNRKCLRIEECQVIMNRWMCWWLVVVMEKNENRVNLII